MVDTEGNIYGIKAYGVIHRGHYYGTLDTVDQWNWGGYHADKSVAVQPTTKPSRMLEAAGHARTLRPFIGASQLNAIGDGCRGEEREFFFDKLAEYATRVETMPKTYEQDGKGDDAVVYLHYFVGSSDWYITERDIEAEQIQAFGLTDLGYGAELGYISIEEITRTGAELDLHFTPQTLREIKERMADLVCGNTFAHLHAV